MRDAPRAASSSSVVVCRLESSPRSPSGRHRPKHGRYDLKNYTENGDSAVPGDNVYNSLLASGAPFNETTCQNPWDYVEAGVPPGAEVAEAGCMYGEKEISE